MVTGVKGLDKGRTGVASLGRLWETLGSGQARGIPTNTNNVINTQEE